MIVMLRQMVTCRWSARRIQRYLDADPSAPLSPGEIARLEQHLATCERCTRVAQENAALHRVLVTWSSGSVDPASVDRVRDYLGDLTDESSP